MNQLDLDGRVAVVTGAARGIGFAIAQRILASGGMVAIWEQDEASHAAGRAGIVGRRTGKHARSSTWRSLPESRQRRMAFLASLTDEL